MADIREILIKFHEGTVSLEETKELLSACDEIHDTILKDHLEYLFEDNLNRKTTFISEDKAELIYKKIKKDISPQKAKKTLNIKRSSKRIYYVVGVTAAACIALIFYFGISLISKKPINRKSEGFSRVNTRFIYTNTSDTVRHLRLEDGSQVSIYPFSQISCNQPFEQHSRNIFLSGKALFDVAKDKKRPFSVLTGIISTTALGTRFFVESHPNATVTIKLLRGKVWVRKESSLLKGWIRDMVLRPGEEVVYSNTLGQQLIGNQHLTAVAKKISDQTIIINKSVQLDTSIQLDKNGDLNFHHAKVGDIFDTLSRKHKTLIHYDKTITQKMYFSGKTLSTDSLIQILNMISRVNKLGVFISGTEYFIQKDSSDTTKLLLK